MWDRVILSSSTDCIWPDWLQYSSAEKDMELLTDSKLNVSQQLRLHQEHGYSPQIKECDYSTVLGTC